MEPSADVTARTALDVVRAYVAAVNAGDGDAVRRLFHFPHIRFRDQGKLTVYQTGDDYRPEHFIQLTARDGWHHSGLDANDAVLVTPDKVHVRTRFTRYRADDSVIGSYETLYIVVKRDDRWGIQGASGNGVKSRSASQK